MKFFLIKRTDSVGYDEYDGFVVRANSEAEAYVVAENNDLYGWNKYNFTITEIQIEGKPEIILESFNAG